MLWYFNPYISGVITYNPTYNWFLGPLLWRRGWNVHQTSNTSTGNVPSSRRWFGFDQLAYLTMLGYDMAWATFAVVEAGSRGHVMNMFLLLKGIWTWALLGGWETLCFGSCGLQPVSSDVFTGRGPSNIANHIVRRTSHFWTGSVVDILVPM